MKDVIITGATGMIGAEVTRLLLRQGVNVTAIVRPMSENLEYLEELVERDKIEMDSINELVEYGTLRLFDCELSELRSLRDKLGWEHDAFFHFGWAHTFGPGRNDASKQAANIKATVDAVHLAYETGCKAFVGAGSQAEFGIASAKLTDELPKDPKTGYGVAKLAACKLSQLECQNLGIRHVWGRIVSCYGPGDNETTMVMSAVRTMLRNERMKFTPAEQIWDYIYVEDLAKAFIALAEKGHNQKCYTIGSGEGRLLREYIYAIRDAIDPSLDVGIGEREYDQNQVMHLEADITELIADTGFVPEISFEEGIRRTISWASEYSNV
ncbi:MAG TPA: NAD(P)-dependent oxidoreductase [Lachnospiraceae bacterium]|nr:NAD(P)-dependent oxidoreductase [Lachnospiraceae bacterium]